MKTPADDIDLKKTAIFFGLGEEKLAKIAEIVNVENFPADHQVIKEGESGDTLFILLSGEVEVSKSLVLRSASAVVDPRDKSLTRLT